MDNIDLKYIKQHYGENFAKLCRELFSSILETPGILAKIIKEKFDSVPTLYEDMLPMKNEFKNYVYSFVDVEKDNKNLTNLSPEELLDEAGYILYPECETEEDIQEFKRYYAEKERLCTFNGGRLDSCRVWFAVKKNVDEIKRENYSDPKREDEYGTSVISIQFSRGYNSTLSIKNRYNHHVNNPDNTFFNNLDNIIPGLTNAFCKKYNIDLVNSAYQNFMPDGYVLGNDGKMYKSNIEINAINYCANNFIILPNGDVEKYDKAKYILTENYLIDLENKEIKDLSKCRVADSFVQTIGEIKSISVLLDKDKNKIIEITPVYGRTEEIIVNKSNQMVKYYNPNVKEIKDSFMYFNKNLKEIDLPNVQKIDNNFLFANKNLNKINLPNLKEIESGFLFNNKSLKEIFLPNVEIIKDNFLCFNNESLIELNLPIIRNIGNCFLLSNLDLLQINLPNVKEIGNCFLYSNSSLREIYLPNVEIIKDNFLCYNKSLIELNLPNIQKIGNWFLSCNQNLSHIDLPNVKEIGKEFLDKNNSLKEINLPNLEHYDTISLNKNIKKYLDTRNNTLQDSEINL